MSQIYRASECNTVSNAWMFNNSKKHNIICKHFDTCTHIPSSLNKAVSYRKKIRKFMKAYIMLNKSLTAQLQIVISAYWYNISYIN